MDGWVGEGGWARTGSRVCGGSEVCGRQSGLLEYKGGTGLTPVHGWVKLRTGVALWWDARTSMAAVDEPVSLELKRTAPC